MVDACALRLELTFSGRVNHLYKLRVWEVVHRAPLTVGGDGDGCGLKGLVGWWGDGEG